MFEHLMWRTTSFLDVVRLACIKIQVGTCLLLSLLTSIQCDSWFQWSENYLLHKTHRMEIWYVYKWERLYRDFVSVRVQILCGFAYNQRVQIWKIPISKSLPLKLGDHFGQKNEHRKNITVTSGRFENTSMHNQCRRVTPLVRVYHLMIR